VKKTYDYLHNYRSYSPDGVCRVGAIYEVVVEGVALLVLCLPRAVSRGRGLTQTGTTQELILPAAIGADGEGVLGVTL
jgi:hypothetical protein